MPGLATTREVDKRFKAFTIWSNACKHESWNADFPRVYITYNEADDAYLLEHFGDIVANSYEEYRTQPRHYDKEIMTTLKQIHESAKVKNQTEMKADMGDRKDTVVYKKSGTFDARNGKVGERIVTEIDGEEETQKTVGENDVVIKGPKGELYVVSVKKFNERYEVDKELTDEFQPYKATGLIRAYEYAGKPFKFVASWDEEMICNAGDFLASPLSNVDDEEIREVYRIEKSVFADTYAEVNA
jgi:hypothetical protein